MSAAVDRLAAAEPPLTHFWRIRKTLPARHGQACRILARGRGPGPRNIAVEFGDGFRVIAHRYAVRQLPIAREG
jgi:hypothetical protein